MTKIFNKLNFVLEVIKTMHMGILKSVARQPRGKIKKKNKSRFLNESCQERLYQ